MGASELPAVLGRNHAATVVYATLYQRIAGVKIVLGLHVDDEGNLFLGVGNDGAEANVIGDCPLAHRFVLGVHAADDCATLVRQHRDGGHLGLALNVLLGNIIDIAILVFFQAGLHNPRQDCLFRQDTLTGGIITRAVICDVQSWAIVVLSSTILTFFRFILPQLCQRVHFFFEKSCVWRIHERDMEVQ